MLHLRWQALGVGVPAERLGKGGGPPKVGEQGRHLEEEMRLCCMRQCARDQGKGATRSSTAHVATKPRTEGEKQHTQTSPNKLRKHDLGTNARDSPTASGASNNPEGSATKVRPAEQDESDEGTRAPGYSTVS